MTDAADVWRAMSSCRASSLRTWYLCGACPRKFRTSRGLRIHQWYHTMVVTARRSDARHEELSTQVSSPWEKRHSYICTDCGENISSFTSLKAHQNEHITGHLDPWIHLADTGKMAAWWKVYCCPDCNSSFNLSSELMHDAGQNLLLCPKCGRQFQSLARLCQHECMDAGPGAERDSKEQKEGKDSTEHTVVGTQEDCLRCTECEGEFHLISDLHEHYMMHARGDL